LVFPEKKRGNVSGLAKEKEVCMKVKHVMNKELVSIPTEATIHDAALKMKEHDVGSVIILEEGGKLEGIVTDRDIAMAVGADFKDPKTGCAYDIMTPDPIIIQSDANVDAAIRIMNRANIRRIPVCENGKVVGLLSSADVASELKEELDQFLGLEEAFSKHA
jgi:CBS domain-containing protein